MEKSPNPAADDNKPRRHWLRFSLRTLLVGTALFACPAGWLTFQINRAHQEEQAIAKLRAAHGSNLTLLFSNPFQRDNGNGEMEMFFTGGPAWLENILGVDICRTVVGLTCYAPGNTFHYDRVDENGAVSIRREYKVGMRDDHLSFVAQLPYLKHLAVEASPASDAGVAHLVSLRQLESLNLSTTAISDKAIEAIARLPKLRTLDVSRTEITDQSLNELSNCQSLLELKVEITKVTEAGVERLHKLLPHCRVQR